MLGYGFESVEGCLTQWSVKEPVGSWSRLTVFKVTLGMWLAGAVPFVRSVLVAISQVLGSIAASAVVLAIFPGNLAVETALTQGTSTTHGFLIELFLTFQLVVTIMMLAGEKHAATFIAPIGTKALLIVVAESKADCSKQVSVSACSSLSYLVLASRAAVSILRDHLDQRWY